MAPDFLDLTADRDVMLVDGDGDTATASSSSCAAQGTAPDISYSDPFVGASRPWLPSGVFDIEAFHIDNDGALDLWIATCDGTQVFMSTGAAIFLDDFESGDTSAWGSR